MLPICTYSSGLSYCPSYHGPQKPWHSWVQLTCITPQWSTTWCKPCVQFLEQCRFKQWTEIVLQTLIRLGTCCTQSFFHSPHRRLFVPPLENNHWQYNINTLRPRRNGQGFADGIFKRIFVNESVWIHWLLFVRSNEQYSRIGLDKMMARGRPEDKPLSEPMAICLPTHICFTLPQWIKYIF